MAGVHGTCFQNGRRRYELYEFLQYIHVSVCLMSYSYRHTHTYIYIYINIMDADIKPHIRVHTCFSYRLSSWGWVKIVGPQGSIPLCRRYVTLHKACSETGIPQIVLSFMNMMKNHGVRGPSAPLSVDPTFLITWLHQVVTQWATCARNPAAVYLRSSNGFKLGSINFPGWYEKRESIMPHMWHQHCH